MLVLLMSSQVLIVYLLLSASFGQSVFQAERGRGSSEIPRFVSTQCDNEVPFSTISAPSVDTQDNLKRAMVHTSPFAYKLTVEHSKTRLKFMTNELQLLERRIAALHEDMMLTRQTLDHASAECAAGIVNEDVAQSKSDANGGDSVASVNSPQTTVTSPVDTL